MSVCSLEAIENCVEPMRLHGGNVEDGFHFHLLSFEVGTGT